MVDLSSLRKKVLAQTKKKVSETFGERDRYIIQKVDALEDIDAAFNLLVERAREWYGVNFPEINQKVKDHEEFLEIVIEQGPKERVSDPGLRKLAEESIGAEMSEKEYEVLKSFAETVLRLRKDRERIRKSVEEDMYEVAPNLAKVAGPLLGARLISYAGSLKKLAMLPASTIQVLGAEKALFKHLTKGTKPPKHGILFQHPWVRGAKKWQRGKIARSLAAKIAIAAREDYFGGKDISEELLRELKERVNEIKEKYRDPPRKKGRR